MPVAAQGQTVGTVVDVQQDDIEKLRRGGQHQAYIALVDRYPRIFERRFSQMCQRPAIPFDGKSDT